MYPPPPQELLPPMGLVSVFPPPPPRPRAHLFCFSLNASPEMTRSFREPAGRPTTLEQRPNGERSVRRRRTACVARRSPTCAGIALRPKNPRGNDVTPLRVSARRSVGSGFAPQLSPVRPLFSTASVQRRLSCRRCPVPGFCSLTAPELHRVLPGCVDGRSCFRNWVT